MADFKETNCYVSSLPKKIRNVVNNLPEYPQLNDFMDCINQIDQLLHKEGY